MSTRVWGSWLVATTHLIASVIVAVTHSIGVATASDLDLASTGTVGIGTLAS